MVLGKEEDDTSVLKYNLNWKKTRLKQIYLIELIVYTEIFMLHETNLYFTSILNCSWTLISFLKNA